MADKKPLEVGDVVPPKQLLEMAHFYNRDNSTYCVRPSCDGCQFDDRCSREDTFIKIGPGINIRQSFRARPGFKWACIDFAGIELRVAAQLSGEPVWVKAFQEDLDLHAEMGKVMFKVDEPTKAQRDVAKMGNFGNLYLAGVDTFWHLTTLTYNEAAVAWKKWWSAVPVYHRWTENQKAFYKRNKYVPTFFGRRREMAAMIAKAESNSERKKKGDKKDGGKKIGWGFCDRTAVNSPVQGTSADLLKMAMNRVDAWVRREKLLDDIKMMLTVHDELDFEIRDTPDMYEQLREIGRQMTVTPKGKELPDIPGWKIPLKVDIEIGDDWGNLAGIDDLDPETKDKPKLAKVSPPKDQVVIVVSGILPEDATRLHLAIFQAANVEETVKVPLYLQMGDRKYTSSKLQKVSEGLLRNLVKEIPGVKVL